MKKFKIIVTLLLALGILITACDAGDKKEKNKDREDKEIEDTEEEDSDADSKDDKDSKDNNSDDSDSDTDASAEADETEPEEEDDTYSGSLTTQFLTDIATSDLGATRMNVYDTQSATEEQFAQGVFFEGIGEAYGDYSKKLCSYKAADELSLSAGDLNSEYADSITKFSAYFKYADPQDTDEDEDQHYVMKAVAAEFSSGKEAREEFLSHLGSFDTDGSAEAHLDEHTGYFILNMAHDDYLDFATKEKDLLAAIPNFKPKKKPSDRSIPEKSRVIMAEYLDGNTIVSVYLNSETGDTSELDLLTSIMGLQSASDIAFNSELSEQLLNSSLEMKLNSAPELQGTVFSATDDDFEDIFAEVLGCDDSDLNDNGYWTYYETPEIMLYGAGAKNTEMAGLYYYFCYQLGCELGRVSSSDFDGEFHLYENALIFDGTYQDTYMYGGMYLYGNSAIIATTQSEENKDKIDKVFEKLSLPDPKHAPGGEIDVKIDKGADYSKLKLEDVTDEVNAACGTSDEDWKELKHSYCLTTSLHNHAEETLSTFIYTYDSPSAAKADFDSWIGACYALDHFDHYMGTQKINETTILYNYTLAVSTDRSNRSVTSKYGVALLKGSSIVTIYVNVLSEENIALVNDILTKLGIELPSECTAAQLYDMENSAASSDVILYDTVLATWDDVNFNFAKDSGDVYYLDDTIVSMKEWHDRVESSGVLKLSSLLTNFNTRYYQQSREHDMLESEFISWETLEKKAPDGSETYQIDIPQFTFGTPDADAANELIKTLTKNSWQWQPTDTILQFEDADTLTFILFIENDEEIVQPFTFTRDGHLLTSDELLAKAGWTPETYADLAHTMVEDTFFYTNEALYYEGGYQTCYIDHDAFLKGYNDHKFFVNTNGELTLILDCRMGETYIQHELFLPLEVNAPELSTDVPEVSSPRTFINMRGTGWNAMRSYANGVDPNVSGEPVAKTDIDVSREPDENGNNVLELTPHGCSKLCYYNYSDKLYIYTATCYTEPKTLGYEIYKDGALITSSECTVSDGRGRQFIIDMSPVKNGGAGIYCVLVFDPESPDQIIEEIHYHPAR